MRGWKHGLIDMAAACHQVDVAKQALQQTACCQTERLCLMRLMCDIGVETRFP